MANHETNAVDDTQSEEPTFELCARVARVVNEHQGSLDRHDWEALRGTMASRVHVCHLGSWGEQRIWTTDVAFAQARRAALDHLVLQNNHTNLVVHGVANGLVRASCNFQIMRFSKDGRDHFHSWGSYEFGLQTTSMRIEQVVQNVAANQGNPSLHRGLQRHREER